jgi:FkbM family methyltransferase
MKKAADWPNRIAHYTLVAMCQILLILLTIVFAPVNFAVAPKRTAIKVLKATHLYKLVSAVTEPLSRLRDKIGLSRSFSSCSYNKTTKTYMRNVLGFTMHLNPQDYGLSRQLAENGIREPESVAGMSRYLSPDSNCLSIGANIGFYTLQAAKIVSRGNGKLVVLEPDPESIRLLQLNLDENGYHGLVEVIQGAMWHKTETVHLARFPQYNSNFLVEARQQGKYNNTIEVQGYTFEQLLSRFNGNSHKWFIRMDLEGCEYFILPTLYEFLAREENVSLFIEFHPFADQRKHKETIASFNDLGFSCLQATREFAEGREIRRCHYPQVDLNALASGEFLSNNGGIEVFLKKEDKYPLTARKA